MTSSPIEILQAPLPWRGARRRVRRQVGFTLAETLLVLIVGAVMLGGATLLYSQVRDNAATAEAQAKVSTMQALIEKYQAANPGVTPTGQWVADQWAMARPGDFDNSAWGGTAVCSSVPTTTTCKKTSGGSPVGLRDIPIDGTNNTKIEGGPTSPPVSGDSGVLVYLHLVGPTMVNGPGAFVGTYDNFLKLDVITSQYAVASEDQGGNQFYFVRGPAFCPGGGQYATAGGCIPPQPHGTITNFTFFGNVGQSPQYNQ